MIHSRKLALALAVLLHGCGGDGPTAIAVPCRDDTASVTVTVGAGLQPTFNWEPACAIAHLLVEEGPSDQWALTTAERFGGFPIPAQANVIMPPVTYGVAPASARQLNPPETLVSGVTYKVILFRVPPEMSTPGMTEQLLAIQEFTP